MRLQSRDGSIFEVEPSAMRLSSLIQDVLECSDSPEEELVPLPAVSSAMLARVIDFCRVHDGVAPEAPKKPLPSGDLAKCGVSRCDCELLDIPAEGLFELLRVATYLNMESLTSLTLAKLASLMIIEPLEKDVSQQTFMEFAASLFERFREHCGKPPCGWRLRFWDAEQSAYVGGGSAGGTPFYVHDETGWYSSSMPDGISWEDGACGGGRTWSEIALEKLWLERCSLLKLLFPLYLEQPSSFVRRMDTDRLAWRALSALRTSAQHCEDILSGSAHVELPQLLQQMLGHRVDPCFQGKIVDLPRPLQRQIEQYLGSEMVTLLADARALVECLGLDALAEELGAQLGRSLDAWQTEVQTLHLMPRVTIPLCDNSAPEDLTQFAQSLELRADGTFVHTVYSHEWERGLFHSEAAVEVGKWSIHRGPEHLKAGDLPFNGKTSDLFEGSVVLQGTAHVLHGVDCTLFQDMGVSERAVKRVISCGELLHWAEELGWAERAEPRLVRARKGIFYLPTFSGALEDYLHRSCLKDMYKGDLDTRAEEHMEELRCFFHRVGAECRSAAAISCGVEPPAGVALRKLEAIVDTVVMEVVHDEEPAAIDPLEAEEASSQLWATGVERMNSGAVAPEQPSVDVAVMHFNKDPGAFDSVLLNSPLAHRAAKAGIQAQPAWANGAKVFVKEVGPELLEEAHVELKPRHVVVYPDDVQEVLDAVAALPSTARPRLKRTSPLVVVPGADSTSLFGELTASSSSQSGLAPQYQATESGGSAAASGGSGSTAAMRFVVKVEVRRTFLHFYEEADEEAPQTARSA